MVFLSANLLQDQRVDFKGSGCAGSLLGAPKKSNDQRELQTGSHTWFSAYILPIPLEIQGASSLYLVSKAWYPVEQNQILHREPTDTLPSDNVPKEL